MTNRMTFDDLALLEPRLHVLLAEARAHHDDRRASFCANSVWYGPMDRPSLKDRLQDLVGYFAERGGMLRTKEAYDLAHKTIYQALPDCRGCVCEAIGRA